MSTAARAQVAMAGTPVDATIAPPITQKSSPLAEFEAVYDANFDVVMAYFARRCAEPQIVADLTSETFVRAIGAYRGYDPKRGTPRAWLFGIAGHVFAAHCAESANGREAARRLAGVSQLAGDEVDELAARIDAERVGRELIERCAELPQLERTAIELVDIAGLTPKEAASTLGVSSVLLRKRLSRARARVRKEHEGDE